MLNQSEFHSIELLLLFYDPIRISEESNQLSLELCENDLDRRLSSQIKVKVHKIYKKNSHNQIFFHPLILFLIPKYNIIKERMMI